MKRLTILVALGILLTFAVSPFAYAYTEYGPQTTSDNYFWFGSADEPWDQENGIHIEPDLTSVSYQTIKMEVFISRNLIQDRNITTFKIMADDVIVDHFEPALTDDGTGYREYYYIEADSQNSNVAQYARLQVVAMSVHDGNKYVVGWSGRSEMIKFKDFPVIDRTSVSWLEAIFYKLEEIKNALSKKMDDLKDAIEKIYKVSPETQEKFDKALDNLQKSLPTEQAKDQAQQVANVVKDSANIIENTEQKTEFGEINWMGAVKTKALDFTPFAEQLKVLRKIMQLTLWCEFFYFVILVLRPRLTV